MNEQFWAAIIGIGGVVIGSLLTGVLGRLSDRSRVRSEDERRWQGDRRVMYAKYLGLANAMLKEIDGVTIFLHRPGGQPLAKEDDELIKDGLFEYQVKWDEQLQPALGEVQLLASPEVADLADRVSGALLDVTSVAEARGALDDFYPWWDKTEKYIAKLRNAMRRELGLPPMLEVDKRKGYWPWTDESGAGGRPSSR